MAMYQQTYHLRPGTIMRDHRGRLFMMASIDKKFFLLNLSTKTIFKDHTGKFQFDEFALIHFVRFYGWNFIVEDVSFALDDFVKQIAHPTIEHYGSHR